WAAADPRNGPRPVHREIDRRGPPRPDLGRERAGPRLRLPRRPPGGRGLMVRRLLASVGIAALLASGCARIVASKHEVRFEAGGITAHAVKTGLNYPAAFTFAPNGTIFFGELQTGDIRILHPSTGTTPLFFHVPNVVNNGEQGLLGIALHPNYPTTPYV